MAEARTVPEHAKLLCDFANTLDVEDQIEHLRRPADLATWLRDHRLLEPDGSGAVEASDAELALALRLRGGIRRAMTNHHDRAAAPVPELDDVARQLPLRVGFGRPDPRLRPVDEGVRGALALLFVATASAVADGSWPRLKLCPADDCRWAFYDSSKNRSRQWCSMGVCGNRQKTRTYRARQRTNSRIAP